MQNVNRAKIASHAFALTMVALATGLVLSSMLERKRVAEQQLHDWSAAVAEVEEAQVRSRRRSCGNRIIYRFIADDGRRFTQKSQFRCEKDRLIWGKPIPVPDKIAIIYDRHNPEKSRALLELQQDISIEIYPLLLFVLFAWVLFYLIARQGIKWAMKLP